jgi:hypothetical protein
LIKFVKKEIGKAGFNKKFSEITNKYKDNALASKILSKPDYLDVMQNFINKTKDIDSIFVTLNNLLKKEEVDLLFEKRLIISMFLYNTITKLIFSEIKELISRFLKKKILCFEKE